METIRARIDGGFWHTYQALVRERVLPYQWKAMNDEIPDVPKSHSMQNFRIAAGQAGGSYEGMVFQDSDLSKWLEAVGYVLMDDPEGASALEEHAREAVGLIAAAQQPDGYINTYFTVKEPGRRWTNLRDAHELYCAGHLIEAGVSMFRGTGDRKLLDVVRRLADLIDATFGVEKGKIRGYPGHEEVELALIKLYRLTGERRYLERAQYFIDERGREPSFFDLEAEAPGFVSIFGAKPLDYYQAHAPVREQREATGHAVRAMYLYTAMADMVLETGDPSLREACDGLWESTTDRKMYLTGGIGASAVHESFSADFDLPNDTAYAETCAAIGLFLFASRMVRIHDEARYADAMERCLYNGILSGISLDGERYFYVNPLEVVPAVCDANGTYQSVKYRRRPWYGCACCPPNVARLLASLGEYVYHLQGDVLYADLYHEGALSAEVGGASVTIRQKTGYPWTDTVTFDVEPVSPMEFTLALRVPAWCRTPSLSVNGRPVEEAAGADGYVRMRRTWRNGDRLVLTLPMCAQRVAADPRVRADYAKVAIQRGPLVYCLEEEDNGPVLFTIRLPSSAPLTVAERPDLLGGVVTITAAGTSPAPGSSGGGLYGVRGHDHPLIDRPLLFIPYYAWANRAPGEMLVWVRE
ncbi:MAG: glycoside hydrolase family 127 protein [Spirochaetes bacterium]|nr:glycoside hydrolase family 127 protein [Spirochaetota bacterium]